MASTSRFTMLLQCILLLLSPRLGGAQETHLGLLVGRTTTEIYEDDYHHGRLAGIFVQARITEHLAVRSEADWVRTAVVEDRLLHPPSLLSSWPSPTVLEYGEVNLQGRLSWLSGTLPVLDSRMGLSGFGGGWLSTRTHGDVRGPNPRRFDFGHLVGLGASWFWSDLLVQVEARSYHGDRKLYVDGPTREGSQFLMALGYRIH